MVPRRMFSRSFNKNELGLIKKCTTIDVKGIIKDEAKLNSTNFFLIDNKMAVMMMAV